jgi:DNA-binding MarR family transcriptional regulator
MDRKASCREIMDLFVRAANKYKALEKIPVQYGTKQNLYHSERHVLDNIGDNPGMNVTEFAGSMGVTKGAISQVLKKLEAKGVARRYKKSTNEKEVFVELTKNGKEIYKEHKKINEQTIIPLYQELQKYPDEKVAFLIDMFKWIDGFLDESKEKMRGHTH